MHGEYSPIMFRASIQSHLMLLGTAIPVFSWSGFLLEMELNADILKRIELHIISDYMMSQNVNYGTYITGGNEV